MAFDAFYMAGVLREVREAALGGRVEKIHQPGRDTVILLLRGQQGRVKLLLAANPAAPRLYLTTASPENPPEPPMFCMLLRKYLGGARLADVRQLPLERAAVLEFDCTDEMGFPVRRRLVAELMGRTCNLYLLDPNGCIIDCLRRIGLDSGARRPALPGLYYQPPEPVDKADPTAMTVEDWQRLLCNPGADLLAQRLMDCVGGLSPLVCREAALLCAGDTEARIAALEPSRAAEKLELFFRENLTSSCPGYTTRADGTPQQFAFCPIRQYGSCIAADSFSGLLDLYYTVRDRGDAIRQKGHDLRKTVNNLCQRLTRKMAAQQQELERTRDRERLRQLGDILTANLHRISRGQTVVACEDFYDENMAVIEIPLSPVLTPQQNAAKCYKDYARMKTAQKELTHQLELGQRELEYLGSVLEELNRAGTEQELEEIRRELQDTGYLRSDTGKKRIRQAPSAPMRFVSTDGFPVFVGRNNRQNEDLTFRMARRDDLWLHASRVHGSHVVIACAGAAVPDDTVTQAAQLAAHYAETAGGRNVAVDVTPVRQVKKIPGGKPGMVIYHSYRTVIANPYPDIMVDALNAEKKPAADGE